MLHDSLPRRDRAFTALIAVLATRPDPVAAYNWLCLILRRSLRPPTSSVPKFGPWIAASEPMAVVHGLSNIDRNLRIVNCLAAALTRRASRERREVGSARRN